MKDLFGLKGKAAIVTGGNGGIGKGIARALARAGCQIVIAARNMDKSGACERELRESCGADVLCIKVDVKNESHIDRMVDQTLDHYGRVDILVNNAGVNFRKMPQELELSEWDEIMAVNLRSAFLCCRVVYPSMKSQGGGKIINIGSMTSIFGGAKLTGYGSSKGGIVQMTRSLAVAWAPDNVQVNAILPGFIDTAFTRQARKDIPDLNKRVLTRTPAGRWGEPDDLGGAAVFLSSPASDFVTGVALPVDGGYSVMI